LHIGKLAAAGVVPETPLADGLAGTFARFDDNGGFQDSPAALEHL
jgi:hypothetical protein